MPEAGGGSTVLSSEGRIHHHLRSPPRKRISAFTTEHTDTVANGTVIWQAAMLFIRGL